MNGLIRLAVGTAVLAVSVAAGAQALYQDESAPVDARVADLIGRLTTEEKVGLLRATSPAIPRLGIDKYYHGNEALHGVVRPGRFRGCFITTVKIVHQKNASAKGEDISKLFIC